MTRRRTAAVLVAGAVLAVGGIGGLAWLLQPLWRDVELWGRLDPVPAG